MLLEIKDFILLKKKIEKENLKIKIISGSMEPFIGINEIVEVSRINDFNRLKRFTPIVFFKEDKLICHLFIKKNIINDKTLYLTKGLNSKNYDDTFEEKYILGMVTSPKMSFLKRIVLYIFFK